jgi:DNA repair exonuclease SbcCD nuclease subunit
VFKFIHAADIHLDSPLKGLEVYEGAPVEEIRNATRRALVGMIELAIDEAVDFVIIAGDVYDGDWHDYNTGLFFVKQATRLLEAGIPLYLIAGNHDAVNRMTRSLKLPENVKRFDHDCPETVALDNLGVAIHGQSFAEAAMFDDLSCVYPKALAGMFNIGVLHTSATGYDGHDRYAPCTIGGLCTKNYDYWALGHIHKREMLSSDPPIGFCGNLQGRPGSPPDYGSVTRTRMADRWPHASSFRVPRASRRSSWRSEPA